MRNMSIHMYIHAYTVESGAYISTGTYIQEVRIFAAQVAWGNHGILYDGLKKHSSSYLSSVFGSANCRVVVLFLKCVMTGLTDTDVQPGRRRRSSHWMCQPGRRRKRRRLSHHVYQRE